MATLLAFCVLLAQTAALAFACDRALAGVPQESPCASHVAGEASLGDVVLLAEGNVCEVHCEPASLPDAGVTDLPVPAVVIAWHLPSEPVLASPDAPAIELEARSGSPPARTLFARLLI